ncbi:MAG TPA: NAD-dependent epimerase/dehydratase family protein [Ktedonobacterales bacterium]|nr:NAD-dependent epimerase/dehydratase family protein [Ktedonobacterales bacterium]
MRVLVIGGVSFIGLAVTRELLAGGHEVAVYHRGRAEPEDLTDLKEARGATHLQHIHADRDDLEAMRPQIMAFDPEVAIHMLAMTEAQATAFTRTLRGIASRAVVISSQDVYRAYGRLIGVEPGPPDATPLTEDAPLRERLYPYRSEPPRAADDPAHWTDEYDKILVERAVMSEPELPCVVIRLPAVYGPNDRQRRFRPWLKRMDDGRPAILLDAAEARWRWTYGYVEDVAHAIVLAALDPRSAGHIYNVGERDALSLEERVRAVAQAAGWWGRIALAPPGALPERLRAGVATEQDLVTESGRIRAELGYAEPTPLAETYARAVAWERANPPETDDPADFDYEEEDRLLADLG